jgi:DNA-binding transcriptional ArsR family regulator
MPLTKAELIVHPVRLRILEALGGGKATARQLAARLPDVPQATLYRQLRRLAEAGVLDATEERWVNGIAEKAYRLREGAAHFSREEFARIPAEDHDRYFAVLLGALATRMDRYLAQPAFDVVEEGMTYFQAVLELTDAEARQFRLDLLDLVARYERRPPAPGRRARTLGAAFVPHSVPPDAELPEEPVPDPQPDRDEEC